MMEKLTNTSEQITDYDILLLRHVAGELELD